MIERNCSVEGCNEALHAKGLCNVHYCRQKRHGSTERKQSGRPMVERFWAKVERTPTCWFWRAYLSTRGYGMLRTPEGRMIPAHRAAYELLIGPIPNGREVDHMCHTPRCVNPDHLQLVSHQANGENRSGASAASSTGVRGVWFDEKRGRYCVSVKVRQRGHFGGRYESLADAEAAAVALRNRLMTNNLLDRR